MKGVKVVVIIIWFVFLMTSCKQTNNHTDNLVTKSSTIDITNHSLNTSTSLHSYYDEWLEHQSDTLHVRVKFLKNGEVYFNFLTRCYINLIKGTFVVQNDLIIFDFEEKSNTRINSEVTYYVLDGVIYLKIKEESLPFNVKSNGNNN